MNLDDYFGEFTRRDWLTATPDTLRVAVVGLGGFACGRALPALDESDFCEVGAVVSRSAERARSVATEYDAVPLTAAAYADGDGTDAYDAVYVITPNASHLPDARTAANLGKHVICEKPLEATPDRAATMVDACEDAGVTLMCAYRLQTDPALRRAREAVRDGVLGAPVHCHGSFSMHLLEYGPADQWRLDPDLAGGGALFDIGVYPLNTARFLLENDPVAVAARVHSPDAAFEGLDEHVAFQVDFGDAVGAFSASYRGQPAQTFSLTGTEGRLVVEPPYDTETNREVTVERGGERVRFRGSYVNEIAEQLDYFAHCVETGETPEPDGRDGLVDVRTMTAVYDADDTNGWVDV